MNHVQKSYHSPVKLKLQSRTGLEPVTTYIGRTLLELAKFTLSYRDIKIDIPLLATTRENMARKVLAEKIGGGKVLEPTSCSS